VLPIPENIPGDLVIVGCGAGIGLEVANELRLALPKPELLDPNPPNPPLELDLLGILFKFNYKLETTLLNFNKSLEISGVRK